MLFIQGTSTQGWILGNEILKSFKISFERTGIFCKNLNGSNKKNTAEVWDEIYLRDNSVI